ncbi:MAG: hypothetical protein IPG81_17830 [Sandaracinaceae bacterium]|nr:hypothetical protein [Sandaracinaceae bacterium]
MYTNGCECLPEASSGNSCAAAVSVGTLSDADSMTTITGNLDAIGDEDWYAVTMSQTVAAPGCKLQVVFRARSGSDVVFSLPPEQRCHRRGRPAWARGTNNLGSYTFDPREENAECTPRNAGGTGCNWSPSRTLYIRVHRAMGTAPTCTGPLVSLASRSTPSARPGRSTPVPASAL